MIGDDARRGVLEVLPYLFSEREYYFPLIINRSFPGLSGEKRRSYGIEDKR